MLDKPIPRYFYQVVIYYLFEPFYPYWILFHNKHLNRVLLKHQILPQCLYVFTSPFSFVDRRLPFCTFSFGHCVLCSSSTYRFWLPLWYPQTVLILRTKIITFPSQINGERNNNFFRNKNNAGQANNGIYNNVTYNLSTKENKYSTQIVSW
jgi:hypothetical protein